jgi:hypothetical protein
MMYLYYPTFGIASVDGSSTQVTVTVYRTVTPSSAAGLIMGITGIVTLYRTTLRARERDLARRSRPNSKKGPAVDADASVQ